MEPQEVCRIQKKLQEELEKSPTHRKSSMQINEDKTLLQQMAQYRNESIQFQNENTALRNSILALHSEVYGARLAAKYLDKELAGRIQQLQLLGMYFTQIFFLMLNQLIYVDLMLNFEKIDIRK